MQISNQQLLELGLEIVKVIAKGIQDVAKSEILGQEIGSQGASGDLTKFADDYSEKIVGRYAKQWSQTTRQRCFVISEETGLLKLGEEFESGIFLVLDPLDGSNNLRPWKTPAPHVGIGLAIGRLENLEVHDNFDTVDIGIAMDIFNNRIYYSIKGESSQILDYGRILGSQLKDMSKMVVGIDLDSQTEKYDYLYTKVQRLLREKKCQRRIGSSILDFAKVACGEYDAFISLGGRMGFYDLAAVKLIVEGGGGTFEIFNGMPETCIIKDIINSGNIQLLEHIKFNLVASGNDQIHRKVLDLLQN